LRTIFNRFQNASINSINNRFSTGATGRGVSVGGSN
jgi:hypothetical protein